MSITKGKNIRVADDVYDLLKANLQPTFKLSKYVEQAIVEKIERERKLEKIRYDNLKIMNS
jgi:nicotinic acid phosphoribosyltransferase